MPEPSQPAPGTQRRIFGRLRAQPGYRTAILAFVLTVILGVGSTVAYAYWNQSTTITVTGSTRSDLPANTTLVGAQPVFQSRPGKPAYDSCKPTFGSTYTDMTFVWKAAERAKSYLVTVKSTNSGYPFADMNTKTDTQTVSAASASFRFPRLDSQPDTRYVVRVMPMSGATPGDPLYFTFLYGKDTNTCWGSADFADFGKLPGGSPFPPLGSAGEVQCAPFVGTGAGGYSDIGLSWATAGKATSYSVRILNPAGYGAETSVSTTSTTFRVPRVAPESNGELYFGQYIVRVQPMNGVVAGDPVYWTYQLGQGSRQCW